MRTVRETSAYRKIKQQRHRQQQILAQAKTAARKSDAHNKWLLGNLIVLAGWETQNMDQVDQRLGDIAATADPLLRANWQKTGEQFFDKRDNEKAKKSDDQPSVVRRNKTLSTKAAAHQRITLGALVIKNGLHSMNRSVLMGALLRA